MYFMVKLCIHTVMNFILLPESDQNMPYLSPIRGQCLIVRKHRHSVETGKFRASAQNCMFRGTLWSLVIWPTGKTLKD